MRRDVISPQRRAMLLSAVGGVVGLVVLFQVLRPLTAQVGQLGREVRTVKDQVRQLESLVTSKPQLSTQRETLDASVTTFRRRLPTVNELPTVIERLSSFASQAGVKLQSISPDVPIGISPDGSSATGLGSPASSATVYQPVPVQIEAYAGYHHLGQFLDLVEHGHMPMRVLSLRISSNARSPYQHRIRLLIETYVLMEDTAVTGNVNSTS